MFNKKLFENFQIVEDGFLFNGVSYNFNDINHISFAQQRLETKFLLVGSDYSYEAVLVLELNNGQEVKLKESNKLISSSRSDVVDKIREIYITISEKTYKNRINKYFKSIEVFGYYEYNGWRFYPSQKRIVIGNKEYFTNQCRFLKQYGFIEVREKAEDISSKLKRKVVGKKIGINTTKDTDIFFTLLKQYFGIYWER